VVTESTGSAGAIETSDQLKRTTKVGIVVSNKMDKSVVVRVDRTVKNLRYKRYVKKSNKFMAHDENNQCNIGDTVEIVESRPLSNRKRWRVRKVLREVITAATGQNA
jgi:small subunit ribosomal protein S17